MGDSPMGMPAFPRQMKPLGRGIFPVKMDAGVTQPAYGVRGALYNRSHSRFMTKTRASFQCVLDVRVETVLRIKNCRDAALRPDTGSGSKF